MTDPPMPSRRWRRPSPVALGAVALIAVQIALRAWVGYAGFFSLDDYVFYTRAAEQPLLSADYLLEPYNAHLMPGAMVWVWLTTQAAPLAFAPVVTVSLLLQLAVDVAMFVLLRRLFGGRAAILLPFAVFLFATLTLPGMVWWAAALNQLPQQLATLLALLAMLRYARTRRLIDAGLTVGAVALGLAFSEKTALAMPLVFAFTWLFLVGGPLVRSLWRTVRRYWVIWTGYAVLGIGYLVGYAVAVDGPVRGGVSTAEGVELVDVVVRRALLPGILGGPWTWEPIGWVDSLADPHPAAQILAALVVVGGVAATMWFWRGAGRAWGLAAVYVVVELGLLLFTRVQDTGVVAIGAEYRYLTDLGLVVALALGLAILPVAAEVRDGTPVVLRPRDRSARRIERLPVDRQAVATAAVLALVVSSTYSLATYRDRWADNPARPYFTHARTALDDVDPSTVLYDGPVPTAVVWRLLWPATLPSRLLTPTGAEFVAFQPGESTSALYDLDADGYLRPSNVTGIEAVPVPVSDRGCGWQVESDGVTVPLDNEAFAWDWIVQLEYSAATNGAMKLVAGDTKTEVPVRAGNGTAYVFVTGAVSDVRLETTGGPNVVCVDQLIVGLPQPAEW
jgi:hypothetical protein